MKRVFGCELTVEHTHEWDWKHLLCAPLEKNNKIVDITCLQPYPQCSEVKHTQVTDRREQMCLHVSTSVRFIQICHHTRVWTGLIRVSNVFKRKRGTWGGWDGKEWTRLLGCELLESRAVMGITGGDEERNLIEEGLYRSPIPLYEDQGAESEAALVIGHSSKEGGCNNRHKTHQSPGKLHVCEEERNNNKG